MCQPIVLICNKVPPKSNPWAIIDLHFLILKLFYLLLSTNKLFYLLLRKNNLVRRIRCSVIKFCIFLDHYTLLKFFYQIAPNFWLTAWFERPVVTKSCNESKNRWGHKMGLVVSSYAQDQSRVVVWWELQFIWHAKQYTHRNQNKQTNTHHAPTLTPRKSSEWCVYFSLAHTYPQTHTPAQLRTIPTREH